MNEMNFRTRKSFRVSRSTIWGCWYLVGWAPKKAPLRTTLSIGSIFWWKTVCSKTLFCRLRVGHQKNCLFGSGSAHVRNFWNVSRRHFRYYNKKLSYGWQTVPRNYANAMVWVI